MKINVNILAESKKKVLNAELKEIETIQKDLEVLQEENNFMKDKINDLEI